MVSIILVNWNRPALTIICLDSLLRLAGPQPSIIVCENASGDGSYQILRQALLARRALSRTDWQDFHWCELNGTVPAPMDPALPSLVLMRMPYNLGFAGAVNRCLHWVLRGEAAEYVWVLNNDTAVDEQALVALLNTMNRQPEVALCGSTLLYMDSPLMIQAVGGMYNPWFGLTRHLLAHCVYSRELCQSVTAEAFDYVVGGSLLFRRSALERVGLLSEDYFLYFEELDWCCRMRQIAPEYRLGYAPESLVYHLEGASTGSNSSNGKTYCYAADYFFQTSRLRFARRHYPTRYWLVWASLIGVALNRLRRRQWRSLWMVLGLWVGWLPKSMTPAGSGGSGYSID